MYKLNVWTIHERLIVLECLIKRDVEVWRLQPLATDRGDRQPVTSSALIFQILNKNKMFINLRLWIIEALALIKRVNMKSNSATIIIAFMKTISSSFFLLVMVDMWHLWLWRDTVTLPMWHRYIRVHTLPLDWSFSASPRGTWCLISWFLLIN